MEQASKTPAFLPFRNQEFQAVVSLPRHKGLGSCQGPFHSPALPSPAGLCQSYPPPHTPVRSLVQHARACPFFQGAAPEALVPTQVWLPQEAPAWQGEGGEHLLIFGACP